MLSDFSGRCFPTRCVGLGLPLWGGDLALAGDDADEGAVVSLEVGVVVTDHEGLRGSGEEEEKESGGHGGEGFGETGALPKTLLDP